MFVLVGGEHLFKQSAQLHFTPCSTNFDIGQDALVMDDEAAIRTLLTTILQRLGYEVESAADGADAVAKYRASLEQNRPFAVVLLDLTVSALDAHTSRGGCFSAAGPDQKTIDCNTPINEWKYLRHLGR